MITMHKSKLLIIAACLERPRSWSELRKIVDVSDPTLMTHLDDLKKMGLIRKNRDHYYELNNRQKGIEAIWRIIRHHLDSLQYWYVVLDNIMYSDLEKKKKLGLLARL